jgi:PAS domain S-box-containing protein
MPQEVLKLLLIEHDPGFARYVGEMLGQARDLPAEMRPAADLSAGLSELQESSFDAVLLDICVPDGAGLGNIPLIKAQAPQLPIIVVGDADDEIVALEAVHAGAQDYLVKSQLTPAWLERSIRYAIERHRMDLALLEAEERYHSVFDHLVEGIFQTTPAGRYLMANAALARIYGYSSPEELIQGLTDIRGRLYVEEGRREEFVRLMQEHDTLSGFRIPHSTARTGSSSGFRRTAAPCAMRAGRLLYYEGTVEDITQRRQMEQELRNSEALYHSLVETLPQKFFARTCWGASPLPTSNTAIIILQAGGHPRQNGFRFLPQGTGGKIPPRTTSG